MSVRELAHRRQVALNLLADRKYAEALVSLETARTFQDTDFIKEEITKAKARMEQEAAAQKTVQDIETVLAERKAVTPDLGGTATTSEMADAIIAGLSG